MVINSIEHSKEHYNLKMIFSINYHYYHSKSTIILSGNSNKELAEGTNIYQCLLEIAEYLNIKLGSVKIGRFADGEC